MAQLFPIHAIRFAQACNGQDISSYISPPYDVLDEEPKQALLRANPCNIVAVDLPVTPPKTVGPDEAYAQAKMQYQQWLAEGVLVADPGAILYAYEQRFHIDNHAHTRRGLFATVATEEYNRPHGVFRHENTIRGGTDDRLKLMTATNAQLSPVFAVFDDADGLVQTELLQQCEARGSDFWGRTSHDQVEHHCWRINDEEVLARLRNALLPKDVFVADGHHRYTTAFNYAKQHPNTGEAARCLSVLVPMQDPGVVVLPTHRIIVGLKDFSMEALTRALNEEPDLELMGPVDPAQDAHQLARDLPRHDHHAIGLVDPSSGRAYILRACSEDPLAKYMPDHPRVWRTLDIAVLHTLFLERVLKRHFGGESVTYKYHHDIDQGLDLAKSSHNGLLALVQPTSLDEVCQVAKADAVMPPKSTFFYPKLATGMVINALTSRGHNTD
ncbi:MAG: DUF1015 domain-containing protein [Myxococcales bacterium]|nr:DUF1015 domain-containing protein [Myxococcales bacterium]MCB9709472.1 DUF1015 domain-containing protein [Myxococcales bacterium]